MSKTPSIAVIPSGYKASKVYSVLPTNGDADLDFTRNCVATRVNQNGLLESVGLNVPRLDYSDGGCPSLLLEPQRTNYVTNAIVGVVTPSIDLTNKVVSPSGLVDATIPIPTDIYARFQTILAPSTFATDDIITYSWYRKRISTPNNDSYLGDLNITSLVNLTNNAVTEQIESDINGFDRFQASVKVVDGSIQSIFRAYFGDIIGVGNQSVAYYGHQLELGTNATSLIYTDGGIETRLKDEASKTDLESYINSSEGVLYAEAKWVNSSTNDRIQLIGDTGTTTVIRSFIQLRSAPNSQLQVLILVDNIIQASYSTTDYNLDYVKIALSYKLNETKLFINGSQVGSTDTDCSMPIGLDRIKILQGINVKDVRVYNEALTDAELIALTQ